VVNELTLHNFIVLAIFVPRSDSATGWHCAL